MLQINKKREKKMHKMHQENKQEGKKKIIFPEVRQIDIN